MKVPDVLIKNGQFNVYHSTQKANEEKLVRDALQPGDLYFNFGDVLVLDKDYFLYFQDRIGDTFRLVLYPTCISMLWMQKCLNWKLKNQHQKQLFGMYSQSISL